MSIVLEDVVLQYSRLSRFNNMAATEQAATLLHAREQEYIARATDKRRQEFIAGRVCAKTALASLGVQTSLIARDDERAPIWPEGITGSISHSGELVGAIVARKQHYAGLGIDIEKKKTLKPRITEYICTEQELQMLKQQDNPYLAIAIFSAKEALYKCVTQATGDKLSFKDATIHFKHNNQFSVELKPPIAVDQIMGWNRIGSRYVYSVVTWQADH